MKVGFLITARLKSTRLPRKLLLEIKGKPILGHMIERLKLASKIDQIIICTSSSEQDEPLIQLASEYGIECFCGDPDDVVKRLYDAAKHFELDYVLNITADCPFVDPVYADNIVDTFNDTNADLIRIFDLPHGVFSYGIKVSAIEKVIGIKEDVDTEVWGKYFTDTDLFNVYDLPVENEKHRKPDIRMTLDYPEDLSFFETIYKHLYNEGRIFSLDEILALLEEYPKIIEINKNCSKKFQKRFKSQANISLKKRYQVKRAAIIGCGSIGQRHIKNLKQLGVHDIVALRSFKGHHSALPDDLEVKELEDWQALLDFSPDIAIVSNPTALHLGMINKLLPVVKGLFIEKPLSDSMDGIKALLEKIKKNDVISYVGYNLQQHPAIKSIEELIFENDFGNPLVFQCQVGQWLPDWHPYEDYRNAYYAKKELGGGAALTLIHEVHLAHTLLGPVESVCSFQSESELLDTDVDEISSMMLKHRANAVSQIHVDFIQKPANRKGVLSFDKACIWYDLIEQEVFYRTHENSQKQVLWQDKNYDANDMYLEEMKEFITYVEEGRTRHSMDAWAAAESLDTVCSALLSSQSNCFINLEPHSGNFS